MIVHRHRVALTTSAASWDTKTFAYKLTEPSHSSNITELETYAFVCRVRIREYLGPVYPQWTYLTSE